MVRRIVLPAERRNLQIAADLLRIRSNLWPPLLSFQQDKDKLLLDFEVQPVCQEILKELLRSNQKEITKIEAELEISFKKIINFFTEIKIFSPEQLQLSDEEQVRPKLISNHCLPLRMLEDIFEHLQEKQLFKVCFNLEEKFALNFLYDQIKNHFNRSEILLLDLIKSFKQVVQPNNEAYSSLTLSTVSMNGLLLRKKFRIVVVAHNLKREELEALELLAESGIGILLLAFSKQQNLHYDLNLNLEFKNYFANLSLFEKNVCPQRSALRRRILSWIVFSEGKELTEENSECLAVLMELQQEGILNSCGQIRWKDMNIVQKEELSQGLQEIDSQLREELKRFPLARIFIFKKGLNWKGFQKQVEAFRNELLDHYRLNTFIFLLEVFKAKITAQEALILLEKLKDYLPAEKIMILTDRLNEKNPELSALYKAYLAARLRNYDQLELFFEKHRAEDFHEHFQDHYFYLNCFLRYKKKSFSFLENGLPVLKRQEFVQRLRYFQAEELQAKQDYYAAEKLLNELINLYHQNNLVEMELESLKLLAQVKKKQKDLSKSEKILQKILLHKQATLFPLIYGGAMVDLGNIEYERHNFEQSFFWYEKAGQLFQLENYLTGVMLARSNLANLQLISGKLREAEKNLQEVIDFNRRQGSAGSLAVDLFNLSLINFLRQDYRQAKELIGEYLVLIGNNRRSDFFEEGIILKSLIDLFADEKVFLPTGVQNEISPQLKIILKTIKRIAEGEEVGRLEKVFKDKCWIFFLRLYQFIKSGVKYRSELEKIWVELTNERFQLYSQLGRYYLFSFDPDYQLEQDVVNEIYYYLKENDIKICREFLEKKFQIEKKNYEFDLYKSVRLFQESRKWQKPEDLFLDLKTELRLFYPFERIALKVKEPGKKEILLFSDRRQADFQEKLLNRVLLAGKSFFPSEKELQKAIEKREIAKDFPVNCACFFWKISFDIQAAILLTAEHRGFEMKSFLKRSTHFFQSIAPLWRDFLVGRAEEDRGLEFIIGTSKPICDLKAQIKKIGQVDFALLIEGESGAGKELVARAVHQVSNRSRGPFVAINVAAIPENLLEAELFGYRKGAFTDAHSDRVGLLQEANGGTLFLDEIGDLPLSLQAKLLRVIQEHEFRPLGCNQTMGFDARVISATNRDLREMIRSKHFRQDLYWRLSEIRITVPPLRERIEDIPLLVEHFLRLFGQQNYDSETLLTLTKVFLQRDFSGNIRELQTLIKEFITFGINRITCEERSFSWKEFCQKQKEIYLRQVIKACTGNKSRAAEMLQISRTALHKLFRKYKINEN